MGQLDGPRRAPPAGRTVRRLVVLLHGYGADGNDLIELAPHLAAALPDTAFVAPDAPDPVPGMPFGRQWFSLSRYDPEMLRRDPQRAPDVYREMQLGAERASAALQSFLDAELARHGLTDDRMALVGFSQGTMMSLQVGLRRARPPAAVTGFSGALVGGDRLRSEIRCRPPVLLVHGDADEIVPVEAMFAAASGLAACEVPVQWHVCPGLGHGIDPDGLGLCRDFLHRHLGPA